MKPFLPAPADPADWPAWRDALHAWRAGHRQLTAHRADYPAWFRGQFCHGMVMLWDEELWNDRDGWRVDALMDRVEHDYGGWDHVVLWNNYPLSGVDPRNQYDYFADLPGGLDGLKACVAAFHRRGVRVLIDHKPWVPGTPAGFCDADRALVHVVDHCDLDGIYLDCGSHPNPDLKRYLDALGPQRVFTSEASTPLEHLAYQPGSWNQFTDDSDAPGIMRNHWFERTAMVYETRRYHYHPMIELQRAWMTGGGHAIWENVFGYWAAYSPRYRSWLRLCTAAQRRFVDAFIGEEWQPLVNGDPDQRIYASRFLSGAGILYTVCNRSGADHHGFLVRVPAIEGSEAVDVISGEALQTMREGDDLIISGPVAVEGIAGVLIRQDPPDADLQAFLAQQRQRLAGADFSFTAWDSEHRSTELRHQLVHVPEPAPIAQAPSDMLPVPGFSGTLRQRYRMRECGFIADGRESELHVYDAFEQECVDCCEVEINDLWVDRTPVTNAQFATFLQESGYCPEEPRNFLAHWVDGRPPLGHEDHPVVFVALADARAYAAWAGKRLPTEAEWQRTCLGDRPGPFPWGAEILRGLCNDGSSHHTQGGTTAVDAFPRGAGAYGCLDMIGNTWEWTESERSDGHTRYCLLKGGSWLRHDERSFWLFDGGPKGGDWAAKLILMHDGWDRCSTIGFRCVADRTDKTPVQDRHAGAANVTDLLGKA